MSAVFLINAGIVLLTAIFFIYYIRDLIDHKEDLRDGGTKSTVLLSICSNVILFFDTLGIGAYAPSTVCFKGFKLVPDLSLIHILSKNIRGDRGLFAFMTQTSILSKSERI